MWAEEHTLGIVKRTCTRHAVPVEAYRSSGWACAALTTAALADQSSSCQPRHMSRQHGGAKIQSKWILNHRGNVDFPLCNRLHWQGNCPKWRLRAVYRRVLNFEFIPEEVSSTFRLPVSGVWLPPSTGVRAMGSLSTVAKPEAGSLDWPGFTLPDSTCAHMPAHVNKTELCLAAMSLQKCAQPFSSVL